MLVLYGLFYAPSATAQPAVMRELNQLQDKLANAKKDTARARLLYLISEFYYGNRTIIAHWDDSALRYTNQSIELCRKTGQKRIQGWARWVQMDVYMVQGNHKKTIATAEQVNDSNAVKMLWGWGKYYSNGDYGMRRDLDSALYFYQKALAISKGLKIPEWNSMCLRKLAVYYCIKEDTLTALKYATQASAYYDKPNDNIANMWYDMGASVEMIERNFAFKLSCFERSLAINLQIDDKVTRGMLYMAMADIYEYCAQDSLANRYYLAALPLYKETGEESIYELYKRLHDYYFYKGMPDKAVYYVLEGLKAAQAAGIRNLHHYYLYIGNSYFEMGQVEKSIDAYTKAFASARTSDKIINGVLIKRMAKSMVAAGRATEALTLVESACQEFIAPHARDSIMKAEAFGICHNALGNYAAAEKYYLQMESLSPSVNQLFAAICPYVLGKFYYEREQYGKAIPYLNNCIQLPANYIPRTGVSDVYLMLYKIDSARQLYSSALSYYRSHKMINDSIFTTVKNRQIEELRLQYDMESKDKELLLRGKDIDLLTKQKELQQSLAQQKSKDVLLKQQNIDLLIQQASLQQLTTEKQEEALLQQEKDLSFQQEHIGLMRNREQLQESQLKQANFIKKMTIGGIVLLLIIVALLYNRYHIKQKNNRQISEKNETLHNLLEEKEWLLKEVHHRVKNNLQVVLSLLQSQSAYLKDDALAAVHDSQHRVQAMSLIHQKLYQSDNVATIDMNMYIPELVEYLKDSFHTLVHIRFQLNVAPVQLDIKQAIPLGLMINEAVTNVFKHAFPNRQQGQVSLSLQPLDADRLVLDIGDDGIGLPPGYDQSRKGSLGMSLMKGLCGDFQAQYTIESREGTHIQVVFARR